jgi:hypothetical protein
MGNQAVINALSRIIDDLKTRLDEVRAHARVPGGPLEERADRQQQLLDQAGDLNVQLLHLQTRLRDRQLAEDVRKNVAPLSDEQSARMRRALAAVSRSIAADADFHTTLALAQELQRAASEAAEATGMA